jgi:hypothetical protein
MRVCIGVLHNMKLVLSKDFLAAYRDEHGPRHTRVLVNDMC